MNIEEKMNRAVEAMENRFVNIRAGRANPAMLSGIMVSYYGTPTPIHSGIRITIASRLEMS